MRFELETKSVRKLKFKTGLTTLKLICFTRLQQQEKRSFATMATQIKSLASVRDFIF